MFRLLPWIPSIISSFILASCSQIPHVSSDKIESGLDLVGGTVTTLKPEVGRFRGCTATLIHSHWALSSAHCLNYPHYANTEVFANDIFWGVGINNAPFSYQVNKLYSFARSRYEFTVGDVLTSDVVLIKLAADVPVNLVRPAILADQLPASGERVTILGFGCTNRNPIEAGGDKQFYSFNFGEKTQALCPGDSGGPVVMGRVDQNGPIWGTNSDYRGDGPFETWDDIFGDIPGLKAGILDIIRENDGKLLTSGIDFPGGDYQTIAMGSGQALNCSLKCQKDPKCLAFTYVSRASGVDSCYLKDIVPDWRPCHGCRSGRPPRFEWHWDRPGGDYRHLPLAEPRPELCFSACALDQDCRAFTYVPQGGEGGAARCHLKNQSPSPCKRSHMVSGLRRARELNTDRPGADYGTLPGQSPIDCEKACVRKARCRAYTFVPTGARQGICWLKTHAGRPIRIPARTSGVKGGLERNVDRPGHDYRNFEIDGYKPEVCQAACAAEDKCRAFTYVPTGIQGNRSRCWLKDFIGEAIARESFISGIKGAEFF